MPKVKFTAKAPLEKLPLAVRKSIRDEFDAEKDDFQTQIAELLGLDGFNVNFNANEIWAYNPEGSNNDAGRTFKGYTRGFISALKSYVEKFGDDGKTHFNEAVTASELALTVNILGDQAPTISAEVQDGVFRILFKQDCLGYNMSSLDNYLLAAIEAAPTEGFALVTKNSIQNEWDTEIEDLTAEIAGILNMPDVVLDPNFEENYAALLAKAPNKDWQDKLGRVTLAYFTSGLRSQLNSQNFAGDDMLQEGLAEVLTSKTFKVRVVDKSKRTVDTIIEDGVCYFQTTAEKWWYNTSDAGSGLVDLL